MRYRVDKVDQGQYWLAHKRRGKERSGVESGRSAITVLELQVTGPWEQD